MTRFLKSIQNRITDAARGVAGYAHGSRIRLSRLNRRNLVLMVTAVVGIPLAAIALSLQERVIILDTQVFVYGGTLGGSSAAITLAQDDIRVVIASDTPHFGGQAVDSGISAFDEAGRGWENYGVYAQLKRYISEKYDITEGRNFGPGNAVVGSLATMPGDVEEFS